MGCLDRVLVRALESDDAFRDSGPGRRDASLPPPHLVDGAYSVLQRRRLAAQDSPSADDRRADGSKFAHAAGKAYQHEWDALQLCDLAQVNLGDSYRRAHGVLFAYGRPV